MLPRMKVGVAVLGLVLAVTPAGADSPDPSSIIGGTTAQVGQFPTLVGLTIGQGLCTGTLIAPSWVMTAAHCLKPSVVQLPDQATVTARTTVHLDTVNLQRPGGRTIAAAMTIPKPAFDERALGAHDIGLILLAEPVTDRAPTPVNLDAMRAPIGIMVTQVGFGASQRGPSGTFGIANVVEGRVATACDVFGGSDANLLCFSQTDNKGKCQGDSGGPSFAMIDGKQTQIGVTSFGDMTCAQIGADTRTDIEMAWLLSHVPALAAQCTTADDCGDDRTCLSGSCIVDPFTPTGVGASCDTGADCESTLCGMGPGGPRCTLACNPGDEATGCPSDFECRGATGTAGACWPEGDEGGCCSTGAGGSARAPLLLGGLIALVLARRRR